MDNFKMDVTAEGKETFAALLEVAFRHNAPGEKVVGYRLHPEYGIILYWSNNTSKAGYQNLPYVMKIKAAIDFFWNWLEAQEIDVEMNDSDVSEYPGYRIFNEDWGHVDNDWSAIVAIKPCTAWYGK